MKNHFSANRLCLFVAAAALLGATAASAQNPPAPAKQRNSLSDLLRPWQCGGQPAGSNHTGSGGSHLPGWQADSHGGQWGNQFNRLRLPPTFGYRNSEPIMCCRV